MVTPCSIFWFGRDDGLAPNLSVFDLVIRGYEA
jgi:hypothetical protein